MDIKTRECKETSKEPEQNHEAENHEAENHELKNHEVDKKNCKIMNLSQKIKNFVLIITAIGTCSLSACSINKHNKGLERPKNKVTFPKEKFSQENLQTSKEKINPIINEELKNYDKNDNEIENLNKLTFKIKSMYEKCKIIHFLLPEYFKRKEKEPFNPEWPKRIAQSRKSLNDMLQTLDYIMYQNSKLVPLLVSMSQIVPTSQIIVYLLKKYFNYPDIEEVKYPRLRK